MGIGYLDPDPYAGPVHKGDLYVRISKVETLLGNLVLKPGRANRYKHVESVCKPKLFDHVTCEASRIQITHQTALQRDCHVGWPERDRTSSRHQLVGG